MNKVDKHCEICERLNNIYKKKNADYGDSFGKSFEKHGLYASVIRLEDKFNRFENLIKNEAQVQDETIVDTLLDMANYAIMTVIELEGAK